MLKSSTRDKTHFPRILKFFFSHIFTPPGVLTITRMTVRGIDVTKKNA